MADSFKILYQGQLGNSVATLATVGALKSWIIKLVTAVNTDSSIRTFGLVANGTGAGSQITSPTISLAASGGFWEWTPEAMTIEAGGTFGGGASSAAAVTVTVFGDEVS